MGFFSSIGSAFSSVCSAVGSAFSSACSSIVSGISNAVSNAGPFLSALAVAIPVIGALSKAAAVITTIGQILGILTPKEKIEDIGDQALQAQEAGISPESYATYQEYVTAVRNFTVDPKKSAQYSDIEKQMSGMSVVFWGLEEKFGVGSGDIITKTLQSPNYFTSERVSGFLNNVGNVSDVVKYFDGKLSSNERNVVEEKLVQAEQQISPEKSVKEIYKDLDNQRND